MVRLPYPFLFDLLAKGSDDPVGVIISFPKILSTKFCIGCFVLSFLTDEIIFHVYQIFGYLSTIEGLFKSRNLRCYVNIQ